MFKSVVYTHTGVTSLLSYFRCATCSCIKRVRLHHWETLDRDGCHTSASFLFIPQWNQTNKLKCILPQSTVCAKIMELLGQNKVDHRQRKVAIISQDSFYRVLTPEQKAKALKGQYNFDHPGTLGNRLHIHSVCWPNTTSNVRNYMDNQACF